MPASTDLALPVSDGDIVMAGNFLRARHCRYWMQIHAASVVGKLQAAEWKVPRKQPFCAVGCFDLCLAGHGAWASLLVMVIASLGHPSRRQVAYDDPMRPIVWLVANRAANDLLP